MFELRITLNRDNKWMWAWWTREGELIQSRVEGNSILQAYNTAVLWAATLGPMALCKSVIQLEG